MAYHPNLCHASCHSRAGKYNPKYASVLGSEWRVITWWIAITVKGSAPVTSSNCNEKSVNSLQQPTTFAPSQLSIRVSRSLEVIHSTWVSKFHRNNHQFLQNPTRRIVLYRVAKWGTKWLIRCTSSLPLWDHLTILSKSISSTKLPPARILQSRPRRSTLSPFLQDLERPGNAPAHASGKPFVNADPSASISVVNRPAKAAVYHSISTASKKSTDPFITNDWAVVQIYIRKRIQDCTIWRLVYVVL